MAAGATYEPIATTTVAVAAASITFSSIPSTYTDLRIVIVNKYVTGTGNGSIRFNSDTATNYSRTKLSGDGTTASSTNSTSQAQIIGWTMAAAQPTMATVDIFSYAGSTYKTCLIQSSGDLNGSGEVGSVVGLWRSTAAITTIDLLATTFAIGTTATLYGIKAA